MGDTAIERVTAALTLHGSRASGRDSWQCPAHDDRTASLSVRNGGGKVLLHCHAGCTADGVLTELGLTWGDAFDEPLRYDEVNRYVYQDAAGRYLYEKVRYQPKRFLTFHVNGKGKEAGRGDVQPVLYRLPELKQAVAAGETIYLPEGEKDVDRLIQEGFAATCNVSGAGEKWRPEYSEHLIGANVVIIADRDEPGYEHARAVRAALAGKAWKIRIAQAAVDKKGADVSDHLDAGFTLDQLIPLDDDEAGVIAARYRPVNWAEAFRCQPDEVDWLFPPILEAGTVNALFGPPGVGKSLITLEIAVTLVRENRTVMYVDDENRVEDTVERLKAFGCVHEELQRLIMYSFAGLPPLDTPEGGRHLRAIAERHEPALVVLDTTTRMVEGDENASNTFLQLYRCSLVPLKQQGITVLRLDHPGKEGSRGQRGSSAKAGDVDTIWKICAEAGDMLILEREKSRSGHGEGWISVRRMKDPVLHHDWQALDKMPVTPQVMEWAERFDRWGIPRDVGRPTLRTVLKEKTANDGANISTTLLALVARYRKSLVQGSSGTGEGQGKDTSWPPPPF